MGKKKNANRELTHEEIWDDSALVRSWDEAVEEYKVLLILLRSRIIHVIYISRPYSATIASTRRGKMSKIF